jgi:glutamine amidotransferase
VSNATVRTTTHGSTFSSVIEHGNVFGFQFHPEKSGALGLSLLQKFVAL